MSKGNLEQKKGHENGYNRRDQDFSATYVRFLLQKKLVIRASEFIRQVQEKLRIDASAYYRSMRVGAATSEVYIAILYTIQDIREERLGRLFTEEEFPPIRDLRNCPECWKKEFAKFVDDENRRRRRRKR
jgi:hypothetical protein